jgi:hypothetical protein
LVAEKANSYLFFLNGYMGVNPSRGFTPNDLTINVFNPPYCLCIADRAQVALGG